MKIKITYLFIYLFIYLNSNAQINLVPNPSFEDTIGDCQNQMGISPMGSKVKNWVVFSTFSTPDYFNLCANSVGSPPYICTVPYNFRGYQYPKTGKGYIGNYLYGVNNPNDSVLIETECATVKLITP